MQRVTVLCVGKLKEKFYTDAAAEYVKRLQRYCKLDVVELPEYRLPEEPSPAEIQKALQTEGAAIRDCSSTNGTMLNGTPLEPEQWQPLHTGDTIYAGSREYQITAQDNLEF